MGDNTSSINEELQEYFKSAWLIDTEHAETITLNQARTWIEVIFEKEHQDDEEFKKAMTSGLLLCRLINKVVPETIPFVNVGKNPITWLENVQFFLDGCRRLGLKENMLFEPYDIKYFGNDLVELERRNRKIAITLFWLSRIAGPNLPPFGEFEDFNGVDTLDSNKENRNTLSQNKQYKEKIINVNEEDDEEVEEEGKCNRCVGKDVDKNRKSVVFEDDLCELCKRTRTRSESSERAKIDEDGKFTLLVEKSERSNEFGVTLKNTEADYPIITAVQKDSYASKSGLTPGDYVITVNGINTGNMSLGTINDKIKSVFTEGHVYLGICRLPPNETLTQKHKDSPIFKQRLNHNSAVDAKPNTRDAGTGGSYNPKEVPIVRSKTLSRVDSAPRRVDNTPIAQGPGLSEWRSMLEKHKRDNYKSELDHATIRDLWNKYIKTSEIDDVLTEVNNFNIEKANSFKESVAQTDGNDSLNRNLTLVGHKLRRSADTYNNHVVCGCCVKPIGTLASIHLDNTNFTYHQTCFSCKHCGVGLLDNAKLLFNVFVVDGLPYCDVCIKKMGMIRLGKIKKMPLKTSV